MIEIEIPLIMFFSADVNEEYPEKFVPMVHLDMMKPEVLNFDYSKLYKECMSHGKSSRRFNTCISTIPRTYNDGKYYKNDTEMRSDEIRDYFNGNLILAFMFPLGTKQSVADKIIKKYKLESHQPIKI